jgi:hypothetical protein
MPLFTVDIFLPLPQMVDQRKCAKARKVQAFDSDEHLLEVTADILEDKNQEFIW